MLWPGSSWLALLMSKIALLGYVVDIAYLVMIAWARGRAR